MPLGPWTPLLSENEKLLIRYIHVGEWLTEYTYLLHAEILGNCYSNVVGVADPDVIPDRSFRASSYYKSGGHDDQPAYGRLNGNRGDGWCAEKLDTKQWLQVDIGKIIEVCAVATQGDVNGNEWVIDFTLSYYKYGGPWTTYKDANGVEVVRFQLSCRLKPGHPHTQCIEVLHGGHVVYQLGNNKNSLH